MNNKSPDYSALLSDNIYLEGALASDTRSLWRRLSRSGEVRKVAAELASDPDRIRGLHNFVGRLLAKTYDPAYRHPNDLAICAALIVLQDSPRSEVRNLFYTLRRNITPSLAWVKRIAEYCDDRYVQTTDVLSPIPRQQAAEIWREAEDSDDAVLLVTDMVPETDWARA